MCNKQRTLLKNNSITKPFFFISFLAIWMAISCSTTQHVFNSESESNDFTEVSHAVSERNADDLWVLKDHADNVISDMAWRALVITEMDDMERLVEYALKHDDLRPWVVLSFKEVEEPVFQRIAETYSEDEVNPDFVCEFFYRRGNKETLNLLMSDADFLLSSPSCAKAAGGIVSRIDLDKETIDEIAGLIFEADDEEVIRNLLYGFWRSTENPAGVESAAYKMLVELLYRRTTQPSTLADEYLVSLTGSVGFNAVMNRRQQQELLERVQLAVVTAAALAHVTPDRLDMDHVARLLSHPNPHVVVQALHSLNEIGPLDRNWLDQIGVMVEELMGNSEVAITYLELLHQNGVDLSDKMDELHEIDRKNPYLKDRALALFSEYYSDKEYAEMILSNLESEGIEAMRAAQALTLFVQEQANSDDRLLRKSREALLISLEEQNRSVLSVADNLLTNPDLFSAEDLKAFKESHQLAVDRSNRSAASVLASVIRHFDEDSAKLLPEIGPKPMRLPDWQELTELGYQPRWILETDKGEIVIELYPEKAPFTVSSIVHLTKEGVYDGVIFHRVVRNFVLQGGDFDRYDGFGGPEYRLPTEPSFSTFKKGMVGIASSGPDTEGSQFFITHTWTPHLDGHYTIFGEVIAGMDVAEKIQIGDQILQARLEVSE